MGQGHILDEDTLALWRFDETNADTRADTLVDSLNDEWTMPEGVPGITDGPAPGTYARKFGNSRTTRHQGHVLALDTSEGARAFFQGSWTAEYFIRIDSLPPTSIDSLGGLVGGSGETEADNVQGEIQIFPTGYVRGFWESGAGTNNDPTQDTGTPLPVGTWVHFAVTKDASTKQFKVYLDGVLQDTKAYASEPTGGTSGAWRICANDILATDGRRADATIRQIQYSSVVRDVTWLLANAARLEMDGLMNTDESTYRVLSFDAAPTAIDSGPHGLHLISEGAGAPNVTESVESLISDGGSARSFNECSLVAMHSDAVRDALLADFTLEAWIRPADSVPTGGWGIFQHGDSDSVSADRNRIGGDYEPDLSLTFVSEHSSDVTITSQVVLDPEQVYHVAFRKEMTSSTWTATMFVNGLKIRQTTGNANYTGGTDVEMGGFRVGAGPGAAGSGSRFSGIIDDVRLSSVARTDEEIAESYQRGIAPEETPPPSAPTITVVSPTPGVAPGEEGGFPADRRAAEKTPVVIRVTDVDPGLQYVCVVLITAIGEEVVYRNGQFRGRYLLSSAKLIPDGLELTLRRVGGWSDVQYLHFAVDAIDQQGNQG